MNIRFYYKFIIVIFCLGLLASCSDTQNPQTKKHRKKAKAQLVEVIVAEIKSYSLNITRTGTIEASKSAKIHNQEEGLIVKLAVGEGSRVKKNDLLVQLDDRLLRAEYNKAVAKRLQAQQNHHRIKRLIAKRLIAQDQLTKTMTEYKITRADESLLKTRLDNTKIFAPFSGVITQNNYSQNEFVAKHKHMLTLIDPTSFIIKVKVSSLFIPQLKVGGKAEIIIDALGPQKFKGSITLIYPTVNSQTRQGTIEVQLTPIPTGARGGQFARVSLKALSTRKLSIPFNTLRSDTRGDYIFVVENNKATRVNVRTGDRYEDSVEIRQGLTLGAKVVSKGFIGLKPGKKVTVTNLPENKEKPKEEPNGKQKRSFVDKTNE